MKKLIFLGMCLCYGATSMAQVGINTLNPRTELEVKGSFKSKKIELPELPAITSQDRDSFLYLVQNKNDQSLNLLDLTANQANGTGGISTLITFTLKNVQGDWVNDFDTKINANNYALVILSAWFDKPLIGPNPALPVAVAKVINGTYHLEADYSAVAPNTNGTWYINCVAYPKTYAKIFPQQNVVINNNSNGNNTSGAASQPLVDY